MSCLAEQMIHAENGDMIEWLTGSAILLFCLMPHILIAVA